MCCVAYRAHFNISRTSWPMILRWVLLNSRNALDSYSGSIYYVSRYAASLTVVITWRF
jgi:hypothetical protein